jgi:flavin reductase (DIM6/NTAB) family NADH-FMN oxidoreductase RutF
VVAALKNQLVATLKNMVIDPASASAEQLYQLLVSSIVPRPIALVSTLSAAGHRNLAPFSFFSIASVQPPILLFCPQRRPDGSEKDTLKNIRDTGEFVVNIVSDHFAAQMNQTAKFVAPEVEEWSLSGLTPVASQLVKPPYVAESKVHFECRLREIIDLGATAGSGAIVLGLVVRLYAEDAVMDGVEVNADRLDAVGRLGGADYSRIRERFALPRP